MHFLSAVNLYKNLAFISLLKLFSASIFGLTIRTFLDPSFLIFSTHICPDLAFQSENALARQRAGQAAMDDKRFPAAVNIFTEAMALLPDNPTTEADKANILCDRAHAYLECKDMHKAIDDCMAALEIRKSHGMAYFRLGAAQYGLDLYDEAAVSYQRAAKLDASLSEQIKVKMRQVNTAKEVEQRKEREAERARAKEEERKLLEEKKVREDLLKKERNEKLAQEKAEKDERAR